MTYGAGVRVRTPRVRWKRIQVVSTTTEAQAIHQQTSVEKINGQNAAGRLRQQREAEISAMEGWDEK